jgi:hypothetical protein
LIYLGIPCPDHGGLGVILRLISFVIFAYQLRLAKANGQSAMALPHELGHAL